MARPRGFDHDEVLKQAMNTFWLKGYEATSISDLTEATNLKPQSLYNAFGNKHELYLEALDYYSTNIGSCLFDVLDARTGGIEAIEAFFDNLIDVELNDPQRRGCMMQNAMMERAIVDDEVATRACEGKEHGVNAFRRTLERAKADGEVRADLDVEAVAKYLVGMVYAVRTATRTSNTRQDLNDIVSVALSVLR